LDLTFTPDFRQRLYPSEKARVLRLVSTKLLSSGKNMDPPWRTKLKLHARIPIVRISAGGVEVDISLENDLPVYKSKLLHRYSLLDPRFPILVKIIKTWARAKNINSAEHGTLNSFSLSLMVVHYLQQVEPPVLPRIPILGECNGTGIQRYTFEDLHDWPGSSEKRNADPVSMLLHGFLRFFARFPWKTHIVSVMVPGWVPTSSVKLRGGQGTAIIVHDPLEQVSLSLARIVFSVSTRTVFIFLTLSH
jgi:hypothetical protein